MSAGTEAAYRLVADHRGAATRLNRLLWGRKPDAPTYCLPAWIFVRILACAYLSAFVSLWVQIDGLIGSDGIVPAAGFLESVRAELGGRAFRLAPTLCWLDSSDAFLHALCAAGTILSVILLLDVAPAFCLILLWFLYLSLSTVSQLFLGFQWDNLLLETGFLAIFLVPLRLRPGGAEEPPRTVRWLLRWLLFRLMFSSGAVKLASGDTSWRNLTALKVHYETQPLPTWIGWWMHQLPGGFQKLSTLAMFAIELVVPFFFFAPRRLRITAAALIVALQLAIAATGNYAFFNLLTIALCVLLLDDAAFPARFRSLVRRDSKPRRWPRPIVAVVATAIVFASGIQMISLLRPRIRWPESVLSAYAWFEPWRTVNTYGLFAVMTTSRPEILIEGSNDGHTWLPYEFRWKPGSLDRRPRFVEPHQPRLDWQMWFAALGNWQENLWLVQFERRLLEGSPSVLRLLARNPFPQAPPVYIRAVVYDYRFTDLAERRRDHNWWRRQLRGLYCPVFSLKKGARA
jgi:hypothetical protein